MSTTKLVIMIFTVIFLLSSISINDNRDGKISASYRTDQPHNTRNTGDINVTSPTHPDSSLYYKSNDPFFTWESPINLSEIQGYSYLVDNESFTEPGRDIYHQDGGMVSSAQGEFMGLADGTWFFHINFIDVNDWWGNTTHYRFRIDTTKPVGHIIIEKNEPTTNEQLVDLDIFARDNASGVTEMQIISDRGNVGPWEEYRTEKSIALAPTDGLKTIEVRFRDAAGVVSDTFNDSIYYDLKGPGEISVTSPTHPDPEKYYNVTEPVFQWVPPYDAAGIKGYSYTVDTYSRTEPAKVLYHDNSDQNRTFPGEFTGLFDGDWSFHITSCDIYNQWGNTTHFKFYIDTTGPDITELSPDTDTWHNTSSIRAEAVFEETWHGVGLDLESIEYSYRKGRSEFSEWTNESMGIEVVSQDIDDNPIRAYAWINLELDEGDGNAIRWRCNDLVGNGPSQSKDWTIKVDTTPVSFGDPHPGHDEFNNEDKVPCGITVLDIGGSGVDGKSIEYCVSKRGPNREYFGNWTPTNYNIVNESIVVNLEIKFEAGKENYIIWRAKDAVENGYSESEPYRVWVNTPPVPSIELPVNNAVYYTGDIIYLSADGTYDNEGDELAFLWVSNQTYNRYIGHDPSLIADLIPGFHTITLFVSDGHGFNISKSVKIVVKMMDRIDTDGDGVLDDMDIDDDNDGIPDWEDAFRLDPAASVDTDEDGYPDRWNEGKMETDTTTGLKLDGSPKDPDRYEKENKSEISWTTIVGVIFGILVLICVVVLILYLVLVIRKKKPDEPFQD